MATKKAASKKRSSKKASAKKRTTKKKVSKKASAKKKKVIRKSKVDESKKIQANPGLDEFFYQKFPRYQAYSMLCSSPNRTLLVSTFLDKCEELDGVKNRAQARGILQKLVDKKRHCGSVVAKIV